MSVPARTVIRTGSVKVWLSALLFFSATHGPAASQEARTTMIERAASLELDTPHEPPAEDPEGMTAALVIAWHGQIIGERYGDGISVRTPLESWSTGKSVSATLMGILIEQGIYQLDQPAPIPQWQSAVDPRREIRIADLLRMSSGLRFRAPMDPEFDGTLGYPEHLYVYTGGVNIFEWTAGRTQQWPPNTVGRYRNGDPVIVNYLIRLAAEERGLDYHSFPSRALFDKIGIRDVGFLIRAERFVEDQDSYITFACIKGRKADKLSLRKAHGAWVRAGLRSLGFATTRPRLPAGSMQTRIRLAKPSLFAWLASLWGNSPKTDFFSGSTSMSSDIWWKLSPRRRWPSSWKSGPAGLPGGSR